MAGGRDDRLTDQVADQVVDLGGLPSGRRGGGKKLTQPGPLASLMPLALRELDAATIETWAAKEGQTRPSLARLACRLLTVFLTWFSEQPAYAPLLPDKNPDKNPGKTRKARKARKAREALGAGHQVGRAATRATGRMVHPCPPIAEPAHCRRAAKHAADRRPPGRSAGAAL